MTATPFEKPFNALDEHEKILWQRAAEVLDNGDRLYGQSPEDRSHIWWALGLALASLKEQRKSGEVIALYIEIGVDDSGFFVSSIQGDRTGEE